MNSLLAVFLVICGIGFLFLMLSLFLGDLFEAFDADLDLNIDSGDGQFGMLDSRVISVFLTAFGAFAALVVQFGFGLPMALIAGVGGGLVFGSVVFGFGYLLYSQQSTSSIKTRDFIGRTAKVTVTIEPGSVGQISCKIGEARVEKLALTRGDDALEAGSTVFVEEATHDGFIVSSMKGYELQE